VNVVLPDPPAAARWPGLAMREGSGGDAAGFKETKT
jgi:hypothetical protein